MGAIGTRPRLLPTLYHWQETPSKHARICSEHFVSGKPSDLFDQNNPDWAPSLKLAGCLTPRKSESNLKKATGSTNRFIRAKKRKASKAKHAAASPLLELHATTVSDIEVENVADVAAGPNCSFRKLGKMDPPTCKPKRADHLKTFTPDAQGPSDASQHDRIKTELRLESPESAHLFEENVTQSDHWLQLHTGLPSLDMFSFLLSYVNGVLPTSTVMSLFSGRTSDGVMTRLSGFLDKLQSGDQVMSNQSFLITEELANHGATLIIPAFSPEPLSSSDVDQIRVRIQVEKAIERLKSFRILRASDKAAKQKGSEECVAQRSR
uniref:DDE Tnp4 domain-containing protein n=1 Tax=Knipowitschia caucasica TaxID=637954 RepID=A0AAV2KBK8_KNICA